MPVDLGAYRGVAHGAFEALAYGAGFRWYLRSRRPGRLDRRQTWAVVAGAAVGAAFGSKALALLQQPPSAATGLSVLAAGKSVVGGLLGGWAGVEWAKRGAGVARSTGDDIALPLLGALALGRVACFLGGLDDNTAGVATALPWAVDFGDGVPRHPCQLYEILFLLPLGAGLAAFRRRPHREGDVFLLFLLAYLLFRAAVDFLKPYPRWLAGLGAIQAAALAGAALCVWRLASRAKELPCE